MLNKVLFEAVKGRQAGVVSAILKRIDNVDQTDGEGMTALMMASRDGALPIVKLLLKAGAQPPFCRSKRTYGLALDFVVWKCLGG